MQYFTFLGLGSKNPEDGTTRYDKLDTTFKNDEMFLCNTSFIQEAVWKKYKDDINTVSVFVTSEAKRKTLPELQKTCPDIPLECIDISDFYTFEEFIPLLIEHIKDEKIIIDVTHCFRSVPLRMVLAFNYIDQMKDVEIEHVFYGQKKENIVTIEDLQKDYEMQKISLYLNEFNDTLTIATDKWPSVLADDRRLTRFMKAIRQFNEMLELSAFDKAVISVEQIIKEARTLEAQPDEYRLLIPLLSQLIDKLQKCAEGTPKKRKAALIQLLIKHKRYQLAATFIDGAVPSTNRLSRVP